MARGDIHNDMFVSLTSGATTDIQPGSGDEWMFRMVTMSDMPVTMEGYDGSTATGSIYASGVVADDYDLGSWGIRPLKILMTNTHRIRINNGSGGTTSVAWCAVEVK